eukprot:scaffold35930_cov55-Attheya_sp.AAC.3
MLHVINSILSLNAESILTQSLQTLCRISAAQNTGLRKVCIFYIAPASLCLCREPETGTILLWFQYCYEKGVGPGVFTTCVLVTNAVESNFPILLLVLCQRRGMIKSALNVLNGTEELKILDPAKYESASYQRDKLVAVSKKFNKKNVHVLKSNEDISEDDDKEFISQHNFLIEAEKNDTIEPLWVSFGNNGITSSRRISYKSSCEDIGFLFEKYGYIKGIRQRFGSTGGRHALRQNSKNGAVSNLDKQVHLNMCMSHTSSTALMYYEDADAYRSMVPANIATNVVPAEAAIAIMNSYSASPAFKKPRCFHQDTEVLQTPLPPYEVFVRQHAFSPVPSYCWGVGCTKKFLHEEDNRMHMRHNCNQAAAEAICTICGISKKSTTNKSGYRAIVEHMCACHPVGGLTCKECQTVFSKTTGLTRHMKRFHPDVQKEKKKVQNFPCDQCDLSYSSRTGLKRHVKNHHTTISVVSEPVTQLSGKRPSPIGMSVDEEEMKAPAKVVNKIVSMKPASKRPKKMPVKARSKKVVESDSEEDIEFDEDDEEDFTPSEPVKPRARTVQATKQTSYVVDINSDDDSDFVLQKPGKDFEIFEV